MARRQKPTGEKSNGGRGVYVDPDEVRRAVKARQRSDAKAKTVQQPTTVQPKDKARREAFEVTERRLSLYGNEKVLQDGHPAPRWDRQTLKDALGHLRWLFGLSTLEVTLEDGVAKIVESRFLEAVNGLMSGGHKLPAEVVERHDAIKSVETSNRETRQEVLRTFSTKVTAHGNELVDRYGVEKPRWRRDTQRKLTDYCAYLLGLRPSSPMIDRINPEAVEWTQTTFADICGLVGQQELYDEALKRTAEPTAA